MPSPITDAASVDVLIVGAGPAGLMAANALARAGVHIRIVDIRCEVFSSETYNKYVTLYRPTSVSAGQADGIMPRTVELFQVCPVEMSLRLDKTLILVSLTELRPGGFLLETCESHQYGRTYRALP